MSFLLRTDSENQSFDMTNFAAIFLMLLPLEVFAQQLTRVVKTYPNSKDVSEVYNVLKDDPNVRHGDYYSFYEGELSTKELKTTDFLTGLLGFKEKGHYDHNLKTGDWIFFDSPRRNSSAAIYNVKIEEGKYSKDEKIGVWKAYVEGGKVIKPFDHDKDLQLSPMVKVHWIYPSEARRNQIQGDVQVKVTYKDCEPVTFEILQDIGYGCAAAVIESIKERSRLEKQYGVPRTKCDMNEVLTAKFRLGY